MLLFSTVPQLKNPNYFSIYHAKQIYKAYIKQVPPSLLAIFQMGFPLLIALFLFFLFDSVPKFLLHLTQFLSGDYDKESIKFHKNMQSNLVANF